MRCSRGILSALAVAAAVGLSAPSYVSGYGGDRIRSIVDERREKRWLRQLVALERGEARAAKRAAEAMGGVADVDADAELDMRKGREWRDLREDQQQKKRLLRTAAAARGRGRHARMAPIKRASDVDDSFAPGNADRTGRRRLTVEEEEEEEGKQNANGGKANAKDGTDAADAEAEVDDDAEPRELWDALLLLLTSAHFGRVLPRPERSHPPLLVDAALGLALRGLCPPDLLEFVVRCHPDELRRVDGRGRLMLHRALEDAAEDRAVVRARNLYCMRQRRKAQEAQRTQARAQAQTSVPSLTDAPVIMEVSDATTEDEGPKEEDHAAAAAAALEDEEKTSPPDSRAQRSQQRRGSKQSQASSASPSAEKDEPAPSPPPVLSPAGVAVRTLLSAYPNAASHRDSDGRLPLHIAAGAQRAVPATAPNGTQPQTRPQPQRSLLPPLRPVPLSWSEDGVEEVFLRHPKANSAGEGRTGLTPFMIAAAAPSDTIVAPSASFDSATTTDAPSAVGAPSPSGGDRGIEESSTDASNADADADGKEEETKEDEDDDDAVDAAFRLLVRAPWLVAGGIPFGTTDGKDNDESSVGTDRRAEKRPLPVHDGPSPEMPLTKRVRRAVIVASA
uniref:Uncharacterized protein n=2 Tax=Odontella aurita TaxID=265563 RepID=A0A7S4I3G9_9STRA|mmetsp:Transcript_19333/g.56459  ORF Transcript_19333/g.56459 Transcript_19333/m.56459 type:complete len:620 (+) Transcript_19333:361-2220(+)